MSGVKHFGTRDRFASLVCREAIASSAAHHKVLLAALPGLNEREDYAATADSSLWNRNGVTNAGFTARPGACQSPVEPL
jgi:hypothetical protein